MAKVKILFVDHSPFIGGAQLWIASHIKHLNRQKFEPSLVVSESSPNKKIYQESKVPVYTIEFAPLKRLNPFILPRLYKSIRQFKALVRQVGPDLVVTNTTRALIIAALAKGDYKLFAYILDYDYPKWLISFLTGKIDKFLFVSSSVKNYYRQNARSKVVYLGTDIKNGLDHVDQKEVVRLKDRYAIKDDDIVVGFIGRLVDWKGPQLVVEAVRRIDDPKVKLLIFGTGDNQRGSVETLLKQRIRKEKLDRRVKLAGFFVDRALAYRLIDILVMPSQKDEPFASTLLEGAMAHLPIIATRVGGTGEFIKDGVNGLLIDAGSSDQITQTLVRLVKGKVLVKRIAAQAFCDVQSFSGDKISQNLENIYLKSR